MKALLNKKNDEIRIGLIPAAGVGSRISDLPLTRILPKPMLPILNKPILEYVISRMKETGVGKVFIIVGFKKETIQEYFRDGKDFGVKIEYLFQEKPLGIAHAISLAEDKIKEPFIVILGDDFTIRSSIKNLLKKFWQKKAIAVTGLVPERNAKTISQTNCVLVQNDGLITKIIEKPEKPISRIRGCGIYIFDHAIFEYIERTPISEKRNQKEISDTLDLLSKSKQVYGDYLDGVNININTLDNLNKATNLLRKTTTKRKDKSK